MKRFFFIIWIIINAVACEMESRLDSIDVISGINAYVGDKIKLNVAHTPSDAIVPAYHFKTNNRFIASVNDQGTVVCNHVGTCTIMIATADTRFSTACIVTVLPNNQLFSEPALDFNISKTVVKLRETNRTIVCETATMLIYQNIEEPLQQVMYQFDENQKLRTTAIKLSAGASSKLTDFMTERYEQYPSAERNDLQVWRGNDMEVVTKMVANSCFVVYNPFSGKSTCAVADHSIETFRNSGK